MLRKNLPQLLISLLLCISPLILISSNSKKSENNQLLKDSINSAKYNHLAEKYRKINTDSSLIFAQQAFDTASISNNIYQIALAERNLGSSYLEKGNYHKAIQLFNNSLAKCIKINDIEGLAFIYLNLGHLYNGLLDFKPDSCHWFYDLAYNYSDSINSKKGMANAKNGIAAIYYYTAKYDSAMNIYKDILNIYTNLKDTFGIGNTYNNIALIYLEQGRYIPALDHFHIALEFYNKVGDEFQSANTASSMGTMYLELNDLENAEKYLKTALMYFENIENPHYLSMAYSNISALHEAKKNDSLGFVYRYKSINIELNNELWHTLAINYAHLAGMHIKYNQFDSALHYYKKAVTLSSKYNDNSMLGYVYTGLGKTEMKRGNYSKALEYSQLAWELLKDQNQPIRVEAVTGLLSELYLTQNNYKKAYEFLRLYNIAKDSLINEDKIRTLTGKEYLYEFAKRQHRQELLQLKKNKEIELERRRDKNIQYYLVIILLALLLTSTLAFILYRTKKRDNYVLLKKNQIIDVQNKHLSNKYKQIAESEKKLAELNATKDRFFSIIAHDIKNPLSGIISFAGLLKDQFHDNDEEKNKNYLNIINQSGKSLNKLLENLLEWGKTQTGQIAFTPENIHLINVINPLVELFKPNIQSKNIILDINVNKDEVVYADSSMLSTIIRNLIGNAIKFTPQNKTIYLESFKHKNEVKILIKDEGIGISEENQQKIFKIDQHFSNPGTEGEKGTGLGLILCKEFVEKNGGKIDVISKLNEGSTFWFTLPVKNNLT